MLPCAKFDSAQCYPAQSLNSHSVSLYGVTYFRNISAKTFLLSNIFHLVLVKCKQITNSEKACGGERRGWAPPAAASGTRRWRLSQQRTQVTYVVKNPFCFMILIGVFKIFLMIDKKKFPNIAAEMSLIVPDFTFSVSGSSCNSLFVGSFSLFSFLYQFPGLPSCLGEANT